MLVHYQRRLIYFPAQRVPAVESVLPGAEEVTLETDGGLTLAGWFLPAQAVSGRAAAATDTPRLAVIVFNGNAGNRAYRAPLAEALARRAGVSVLLFDYRGFGGNPGVATEDGLAADARAARAYLASRPDVDPEGIVYFGESLGSAVAVRLATEHPPAALVLRSPITSLPDVGAIHYPYLPVRLLVWDRYAAIERIARVGAPVLVVVAEHDSIVPPRISRRLFDAALEPKRLAVIPGADHNDAEILDGDRLMREIVTFLREHGVLVAAESSRDSRIASAGPSPLQP